MCYSMRTLRWCVLQLEDVEVVCVLQLEDVEVVCVTVRGR